LSDIKFSDGISFDTTSSSYHLTCRKDGWYVVGKGMLTAVNSVEDGREFIREMQELEELHAKNPGSD
jgi:hypothetical protein